MLNLIIAYQKPRLLFYMEKLKNSFQNRSLPEIEKTNERPLLTDAWLSKLPNVGHRIWIDDLGNKYDFLTGGSEQDNEGSNFALSAQTINEIEDKARDILCLVKEISILQPEQWEKPVTRQAALLTMLLPSLFNLWKDARFHEAIDSCLNIHFRPLNNVGVRDRRKKEVMATLRFVCRTYYAVDTFVEAAEKLPTFQFIECKPIHVRSSKYGEMASDTQPCTQTPIKSLKSLGLDVYSALWQTDLKKKANVKRFKKLINEEPHIHAEVQLYHFSILLNPAKSRE